MKKIVCMMLFSTSLVTSAQQNLSGVWKLKESKSLSGPEYDNGVPKSIKIHQTEKIIEFEIATSYDDKDTSEFESFKIGRDQTNQIVTRSNRTLRVTFAWDSNIRMWDKHATLSMKDDPRRIEIVTNEIFRLSQSGNELVFTKSYNGADIIGGNQDYRMQGTYERTTSEQIVYETAKGNGIRFEEGLSWEQLVDKATKENKFIFVDCYATWCAPCRKMDKEVYPLNMVGDVMNTKFISVKVQMDTGRNDDVNIQFTYPIARKLEDKFDIEVLPTYLFFDPLGNAVHKETGACAADKFIQVVKDALDTSAQLYTLVQKSVDGRLPYSNIAELANYLEGKEKLLAQQVARIYIEKYLNFLNDTDLFNKSYIDFFSKFASSVRSCDKIFQTFLNNPSKTDSITGIKNALQGVLDFIIIREEIIPFLESAERSNILPSWQKIEKNITSKYGEVVTNRTVTNLKVFWYRKHKIWNAFCDNIEKQIGLLEYLNNISWFTLAGASWDMFLHTSNKSQLQKALRWNRTAYQTMLGDSTLDDAGVENRVATLAAANDTYANLLYKLGRKKEAIIFYKKNVLAMFPQEQSYLNTYSKMKQELPTWHKDEN